jgi:hypothetical protein
VPIQSASAVFGIKAKMMLRSLLQPNQGKATSGWRYPDAFSLLQPFLESRQSAQRLTCVTGESLLQPFLESRQSLSMPSPSYRSSLLQPFLESRQSDNHKNGRPGESASAVFGIKAKLGVRVASTAQESASAVFGIKAKRPSLVLVLVHYASLLQPFLESRQSRDPYDILDIGLARPSMSLLQPFLESRQSSQHCPKSNA